MPNVKIQGLYAANLWVEYNEYRVENQVDSIYIGSDPVREDIYDFVSDRVKELADETMREDWAETLADRIDYQRECQLEMREAARNVPCL